MNLYLDEELARQRHQTLLLESSQQRLLHHVQNPRSALGSLCISAGTLLIHVGLGLAGESSKAADT
jgi:hypothetical protein